MHTPHPTPFGSLPGHKLQKPSRESDIFQSSNHHVGKCIYYQTLRKKVFGKEKTTIKSVVEKLNINLLAKYLQQAGKLAEYGQ